jgi:hypothetical protein
MTVFIPDRKRLYRLLDDKHFKSIQPETSTAKTGKPDRTEEVISVIEKALLESMPDSDADDMTDIQKPVAASVATSDYMHWLELNTEDLPKEEGVDNRLKRQDLIDAFIANDKQRGQRLPIAANDENLPEFGDIDDRSTEKNVFDNSSLDDSYFTETLARVYFSQKRYDKALEIIRVLSLKYPKKNAYFADQIRYIEKIINLKK